jgi:hypothetical protein
LSLYASGKATERDLRRFYRAEKSDNISGLVNEPPNDQAQRTGRYENHGTTRTPPAAGSAAAPGELLAPSATASQRG